MRAYLALAFIASLMGCSPLGGTWEPPPQQNDLYEATDASTGQDGDASTVDAPSTLEVMLRWTYYVTNGPRCDGSARCPSPDVCPHALDGCTCDGAGASVTGGCCVARATLGVDALSRLQADYAACELAKQPSGDYDVSCPAYYTDGTVVYQGPTVPYVSSDQGCSWTPPYAPR